jgi:hypothetical protein
VASRIDLQSKLEELLGSRNVYYNPPDNLRMQYNAIRYSLGGVQTRSADDVKYSKMNRYELIVITRESDPEVVDKLMELPYCSMGTPYKSDNLNHYPLTLYW